MACGEVGVKEEVVVKRNDVPETQEHVLYTYVSVCICLGSNVSTVALENTCSVYLGRRRRLQGKDRLSWLGGACSPVG